MDATGNETEYFMQELVSVIMPIYNVEKYLEDCIESIINQSYKDLEIILVDDGSPDSCGQICDEYATRDERIKVIHKPNGGLSDARNAGLKIATGEWILFVDSDDAVSSSMVELLLAACHNNDATMSWCNIIEMDEDGYIHSDGVKKKYTDYQVVADVNVNIYTKQEAESRMYTQEGMQKALVAWNKLYHKSLFETSNGKIEYAVGKIFEDGYTTYKLIYQANKIVEVPCPLYFYRQRGGSIMDKAHHVKYEPGLEAGIERMEFYLSHEERQLYLLELNYGIHLAIHYYECVSLRDEKKDVKKWFARIYRDYFAKEKWPIGKRVRMKAFLVGYPLYKFISLFEGFYNKISKK